MWGCADGEPRAPQGPDGSLSKPVSDASAADAASADADADAEFSQDSGPGPEAGGLDASPQPDGGDGALAAPELRLIDSAPADGELWVRQPISLRFSEPLDGQSVSQGLRVETSAGAVSFVHELESDQELRIEITQPPPSPSALRVSVTDELRSLAGARAEPATIAWHLPLFHASELDVSAAQRPLLALGLDGAWLAWQGRGTEGGPLHLARHSARGWSQLPQVPLSDGAELADLVVDGQGRPLLVWRSASGTPLGVARAEAGAWGRPEAGLGALAAGTAHLPSLALDSAGAPLLAWHGPTGIMVSRLAEADSWQQLTEDWAPPGTSGEVHAFALDWLQAGPVLAAIVGEGDARDLHVAHFQGEWVPLGDAVDHAPDNRVLEVALGSSPAHEDTDLYLAWIEQVQQVRHLYVSRWSSQAGRFVRLGAALNLGAGDAQQPGLRVDGSGTPLVSWREAAGPEAAIYVARWTGQRWEHLGGSLSGGAAQASTLALGLHDQPLLAVVPSDGGPISLLRYNESPDPPFGLSSRPAMPCSLPSDGSEDFPQRLSETGCYADLATQTLASDWVPYEVNAPLWSDGALKRRFLAVPPDQSIGFSHTEAWDLPVGTLLAKEFWLQAQPGVPSSRFIVETRFLVKRCQPGACRAAWQGYSYRWNQASDEATLLDNDTETLWEPWSVADGTHLHGYPGRSECTRCHALAAGGSLGLRAHQLNRNRSYGATVDNQLRALSNAGFFGDSFALTELEMTARLPTPSDPAFSLEQRVRGYFDANCANCHRPDGRWPVIDFRYEAELRSSGEGGTVSNICDILVPGDAESSLLYQKDLARPGSLPDGFTGDPMPPLGSLLPDQRQLSVTKAWIDSMSSCP